MSENLKLWHQVEKTPHEHTKPITGKSYKGTSPKPHWIIQKATDTFGPCGIGWGFTVDERIEDGAMIAPGFYERLHIAKVKVWYIWNGQKGEVEHIGGTPFSGQRKAYEGKPATIYTDEDAPKKSVTDALVKALSMVGFAGDIFMGRYDDSKYVNELIEEGREEKRESSKPATRSARGAESLPPPDDNPFSDFPGDAPSRTNVASISERARATAPREAAPQSDSAIRDYIAAFETKLQFCESVADCDRAWIEEKVTRARLGIVKDDAAFLKLAALGRARREAIELEVTDKLRA